MDEECEEQETEECPGIGSCNDQLLLDHNCVEHLDPWLSVFYEYRTE